MKRIISYDEIPKSIGQSVYLRMESDPKLYMNLMYKGYTIVNDIRDTESSTIYLTGRRQDYVCKTTLEYKNMVDKKIQGLLSENDIVKPKTEKFSYQDLVDYKYKIPFVLKNENQNGGREKFLIANEEDYEKLIDACTFLIKGKLVSERNTDLKYKIDYDKYLDTNFSVQDYIETPSKFNTTVRLLTSSSNDLLYAALKYNTKEEYIDDTTLLGYLLSSKYKLSSKSIVSNTLSGGKNLLIGEYNYKENARRLLDAHNIDSDQFKNVVKTSQDIHEELKSELGILCGFDYIYDKNKQKWFLLEYHSRPMVGDYSRRQDIPYETNSDRLTADGRVRATGLVLTLMKRKK